MKHFFSELFKSRSTVSAMRFMAVSSLYIGAGIAIYGITMKEEVTALVTIFVGAAFTGKAVQKATENKSEPPKADDSKA